MKNDDSTTHGFENQHTANFVVELADSSCSQQHLNAFVNETDRCLESDVFDFGISPRVQWLRHELPYLSVPCL